MPASVSRKSNSKLLRTTDATPSVVKNGKSIAGFSLPEDGLADQAQKAWAAAAYFCSGALAINASQLLATPLSTFSPALYSSIMSHSKGTFSLLLTTMTQLWSPTTLHITGNASVRGQFYVDHLDNVVCDLPSRMVLVANHQIYTDWLYLWYIAYLARRHNAVYIVLKESLRHIPIVGWGMVLNRFIFLKRDWTADEKTLKQAMAKLRETASGGQDTASGMQNTRQAAAESKKGQKPMWLMLFPEGTNLAACTRAKSTAWASKNSRGLRGAGDTRHVLLPRSRGLRVCLKELNGSVEFLCDCTIAYSGVPRGQYAQDIYPLPQAYLEGRAPRSVSMHWRCFKLSSIPGLHNDSKASQMAFESWLLARWHEKDELIEYWYKNNGKFPTDQGVEVDKEKGTFKRGIGRIETTIRASGWKDFIQVIAPIGLLVSILLLFAGLLPVEVLQAIERQVMREANVSSNSRRQEKDNSPSKERKLLAFDGSGYSLVGQKPQSQLATSKLSGAPKQVVQPLKSQGPSKPASTKSTSVKKSCERRSLLGFSGGSFRPVSDSTLKPDAAAVSRSKVASERGARIENSSSIACSATKFGDASTASKFHGGAGKQVPWVPRSDPPKGNVNKSIT